MPLVLEKECVGLPFFLSFEGKAFFFGDAPAFEAESLGSLSLSLELESLDSDRFSLMKLCNRRAARTYPSHCLNHWILTDFRQWNSAIGKRHERTRGVTA